MHEMVEIPEIFQTPEFKRLFILAEIGNFTASELKEYQQSLHSMSDYYNIIDSAEKRAREEGRITAILQNAQKMKELGIDVETIIQITGLDLNTISNL